MSLNILLVDDSRTVRSMISKTLKVSGLPINEIHEASNGREAIDVLEQQWIDLALADINMPVMNGIELVEKMNQDGLLKTVPVIIVSSDGSVTRIEQLKAKGVSAYIRKPVTPELIRDVVEDILCINGAKNISEIIDQTICEVLESFAFIFVETADATGFEGSDLSYFQVGIDFEGPRKGSFKLITSLPVCESIACNILGVEGNGGLDSFYIEDSLKEMLNVISGHILTAMSGEQAIYNVSPPEIEEVSASYLQVTLQDKDTYFFKASEGPLAFRISLDENIQ